MRPADFQQHNPVHLDISRSKFVMEPRWTGTMMSYTLTPIFTYSDVMPGDTFKLSTSFVCRMSTPVCPVMDDLWMDVAFYFVPHELILSRSYMSPSTNDSNHSWKAFIGAQDSLLNMPIPDSDITLPKLYIANSGYVDGGIADCMGISKPKASSVYAINPLAVLAFMAVWNENYREPNTQNPGVFSISSGVVLLTWSAAGLVSENVFSNATLPNVCRFHGYFGSCLPWPQRNSESVLLPLGTVAPVITGTAHSMPTGSTVNLSGSFESANDSGHHFLGVYKDNSASINSSLEGLSSKVDSEGLDVTSLTINNLWTDLANASAVSINTFRLAVQEQRWYEALARGGNRIDELTAALFGVMPKDAGGNQPEYLGGKRIPIQVSQVNATANSSVEGASNNTVGSTGAFSLTADSDYYFTKSFDKWGTIIGVACIRYRDSFGQSLNRMFTRHERLHWYFPVFANLGEQPVYNYEKSILANSADNYDFPDSTVFGYQEAWADFRTIPDVVTGLTRPTKSLAHWTYAVNLDSSDTDTYPLTAQVTLAQFLAGVNAYKAIDRTLQVKSSTSGFQFLVQFQHSIVAVRPMPTYSIPGLVDHH